MNRTYRNGRVNPSAAGIKHFEYGEPAPSPRPRELHGKAQSIIKEIRALEPPGDTDLRIIDDTSMFGSKMDPKNNKALRKIKKRNDFHTLRQKFIQGIHNFAQTLIGGVIRKQNISDEDIPIQSRAPPTDEEHHATRPEIKTCATRVVRNYAEAIQFLKDFEKFDKGVKSIWSRLLNRTYETTHASLNDELLEAMNLKKRLIASGLLGADVQRNVEDSIAQLERQKPKSRNISAIDHKIAKIREVLHVDTQQIAGRVDCLIVDITIKLIELDLDEHKKAGTTEDDLIKVQGRILHRLMLLDVKSLKVSPEKKDEVCKFLAGVAAVAGGNASIFQVQNTPELLKRPEGKTDPRIISFNPDDWQVKLLDLVDSGDSAVISAPTSSGKTFIAFYVMEQVLRECTTGEGVVVYVAPSKALVNQLEADVFARYGKTYNDRDGRALCGVFTRDYRRDENNCQILITVPACLEILIFHSLSSEFSGRIRYVIFDEVHNISDHGGHCWERLLLTVSCPFLALSATVGQPEEFVNWLNRAHVEHHGKVWLIEHHERYNDLSISLFSEGKLKPFNPLTLIDAKKLRSGFPEQLNLLPHQCLQLFRKLDHALHKEGDFHEFWRKQLRDHEFVAKVIDAHCPLNDVPRHITQRECGEFQKHLKMFLEKFSKVSAGEEILNLALQSDDEFGTRGHESIDFSTDKISRCILPCLRELSGSDRLPAIVFHYNIRGLERIANAILSQLEREQEIFQLREFLKGRPLNSVERDQGIAFLDLLRRQEVGLVESESDDQGEGIVFAAGPDDVLSDDGEPSGKSNTDAQIKLLAHSSLFGSKDERERYYQATSVIKASFLKANESERVKLLKAFENDLKCWESLQQKKKSKKPRGGSKEERDEAHANHAAKLDNINSLPRPEEPDVRHLEPDYVHPDFCLSGNKPPPPSGEIEEALNASPHKLKKILNSRHGRLLSRCMKRGFGIHHANLGTNWKRATERLFRKRKLATVLATGTLAQGINMPCKTVVVAGNSAFIGAVQYHQLAGRAGRRNFDNKGDVVLLGVSQDKVKRLLLHQLPKLTGHAPLTPIMTLRMFLRYTMAKGSNKFSKFSSKDGNPISDREEMVAMIRRSMSNPLCGFDSASQENRLEKQLPHFFVFLVDFLCSVQAIRPDREHPNTLLPTAMCSFLAHLHYFEPMNIAMSCAIYSGVFDYDIDDDVAEPAYGKDFSEEVHREVLSIISYFMFPRALPPWLDVDEARRDTNKLFEVQLPELPAAWRAFIDHYNRRVLSSFSSYVRLYSKRELSENENCMPAAAQPLYCEGPDCLAEVDNAAGLLGQFNNLRQDLAACSPFVAVDGGSSDDFSTIEELLHNSRHDVYLDRKMCPTMMVQGSRISAVILDFYNSGGNQKWIEKYHGLRRGAQWQYFSDVTHALKVVADALKVRIPAEDRVWEDPRFRLMRKFKSTSKAFDKLVKKLR